MIPSENELICPVSYEVAAILLGGGPDTRSSFWKVYRQELALNQKTQFRNEHVRICGHHLKPAMDRLRQRCFYRNGSIVTAPA